jgi:hypothetical protein
MQRAYKPLTTSLAVVSVGVREVGIGVVGEGVVYLEHPGGLDPLVSGESLHLGAFPEVEPELESVERRSGIRLLLAAGGALELVGRRPELARSLSCEAVVAAARELVPSRDAGFVCVWL